MPDSGRRRLIGSGFSNRVYELASGEVCRTPLTVEAEAAVSRQCRFLPRLAGCLPAAVPVPRQDEHGCMIYRKLPGVSLQPEMLDSLDTVPLARDVADFLSALHAIPVCDATAWGVPDTNRTSQLLAAADRVIPLLPAEMLRPVSAWRASFVEMEYAPAVIHGDFWYENLLVACETGRQSVRLTGVIDFDSASIGDPAWDLATLLHGPPEWAELVFNKYRQRDEQLWKRAEALFTLRPFEGLDLAARFGDTAEFADGLRKLAEVLPSS